MNLPSMKEARQKHSAIVLGYQLYVFGGCQDVGVQLGSIELLEIATGAEWEIITSHKVVQRQLAAVV